jgi:predicted nucleic acid-binding protein
MSGNAGQRLLYWDACIYLAWLKGETEHGQSVIDGLAEAAEENWNARLTIVTSTITFVEVLSATLTADQEAKFRHLFRKQDHSARDVDPPVAMKARDFRCGFLDPDSKRLATADAIHLATASIFKVDEFWTLDGGGKGKAIGLLELSGNAKIDGLLIKKPYPKNPPLPFSLQQAVPAV